MYIYKMKNRLVDDKMLTFISIWQNLKPNISLNANRPRRMCGEQWPGEKMENILPSKYLKEGVPKKSQEFYGFLPYSAPPNYY